MLANGEIEKETSESTDLISFNININKEDVEYKFMIKSDEVNMALTIVKQEQQNKLIKFYERIINDLNEIKSLHKNFSEFTSYQEFSKYFQNQNRKNNLEIWIEYQNLISIKLKEENILLDFSKKEPNLDLIKNYFNEENCDIKNDLKSINKKLKEENENIIKELKIIKEEIEKLKKKNEDKQYIPNKNAQPENRLNKISSNIDKIRPTNQINNNKNNEIKKPQLKTDKNPSEEKIKTIMDSKQVRKSYYIEIKDKKTLENFNVISEEKKNNDSIDVNKINNSKGRNYNKRTHNVYSYRKINYEKRTNFSNNKSFSTIRIEQNLNTLIKKGQKFDYRSDKNSKNKKIDNHNLKVITNLKQIFNNTNKDEKYINLKKFLIEVKDNYNRNIGSIFQCILNNKKLVDYFLNHTKEIKNNKDNSILSNSFLELIESICYNKNIEESLNNFKNAIDKKTLLFSSNNQNNNSENFISFFIQELHKELNKVKNENNDMINCIDKNPNKFPKNIENYIQNNYNSIISQLFFFIELSQINCLKCGINPNNIEINYLLIFSLDKIKEFKGKGKNIITIKDCFKFYKKAKNLKQFCNNCKEEEKKENNIIFMKGPKILLIYLNSKKKLGIKYELEEKINLDNFIYCRNNTNDYELINVVSEENKNCLAFCKSFSDNKWYRYEKKNPIQVTFSLIKNKEIPLLLFYSKIET